MPYEHYSEELVPVQVWLRRVFRSIGLAILVVAVSLGFGVVGYHCLGDLSWIDSTLEASMILGGEGPIAPMKTEAVKLFASGYALFSGLVLLSMMGIILAPWLHRMLHAFHAEEKPRKTK